MKNDKHQQAKNLYFQTDLTKTEIAAQLGINRRTVMLWTKQGNWDELKKSAEHLPSLVAEKCYYLLDQFATRLLFDGAVVSQISHKDADVINKLASSIRKLKNRSTTNESMEMFNFFVNDVKKKNPQFAEEMMPYIEQYIATRKDIDMSDFLTNRFSENAIVQAQNREVQEHYLDQKDLEAFKTELEKAGGNRQAAVENWQKQQTPLPNSQTTQAA
jgi:hypothetical protein